ncbi:hypothetical protein A2961_00695 [Candidatus Woesebacteria bacterium RIFCSPLOWO2_01_FULL_39_21]|uniref:Aminoglycoside phosphotransferase domain-containing protein n=1 Tax=Candidatus Woesebacteria bacterium RIFCSPLOWO2_01_FULL_39_21 TaxID=1802519 RepID=A0A1F8BNI5_9BACT|nr:MAG: hypothetical protein A2691_01990 [Candidatus Woesebacteria bacterium RIFCSPHIGHO2_01_FULL_39_23]OGM65199.1 MAG: hypothetical protein A2961_00695 [Candidatus Woesebacteria bacterium RIFCSPLOWO2_01_FULL_39_21]
MLEDKLEFEQQSLLETSIAGSITLGQIVEKVADNYDFSGLKPTYLHHLPLGLEAEKYTFWIGEKPYLLKMRVYDQSEIKRAEYIIQSTHVVERKLEDAGVPIVKTAPTKNWNSKINDYDRFITLRTETAASSPLLIAVSISPVFVGRYLENPDVVDVQEITRFMAKFHQTEGYGIVPAEDSWSLLRLTEAYENDSSNENLRQTLKTITPVVNEFRVLKYQFDMPEYLYHSFTGRTLGKRQGVFPKAFAHGDLHPGNILKGATGEYRILDLGCMDYQPRVVDLAIFLAQTCANFGDTEKTRELFQASIKTYEENNGLTDHEKSVLPLLIRANYAMFALRSAELLQENPDDQEIRDWHERSIKGLEFMQILEWNHS